MPHPRNLKRVAVLCLVAIALFPFAPARRGAAQVASGYEVIDLGTFGSDAASTALGISNSGRIVGHSGTLASNVANNPFAWLGSGPLIGIGNFGGLHGTANAVNELGYTVGSAELDGGIVHAYIWSEIFNKRDIGTLGGTTAVANDINNANQAVGASDLGLPGQLADRGFVWTYAGGMQMLPTLGGTSGAAYGINDAGQIVGAATTATGATHAYLLSGGSMTDLGTFGGQVSAAYDINNGAVVVGYATFAAGAAGQTFHAFRWTASTGLLDLGALGGASRRSIAHAVNERGQVVGASEIAANVYRAFIWAEGIGMQDLNDLAFGSGWTLIEARGINDKEEIVGYGINPQGQSHAFLLKPLRDEIPGGEPPPCAAQPPFAPILLPQSSTTKATTTTQPRTEARTDRRTATTTNRQTAPDQLGDILSAEYYRIKQRAAARTNTRR
jgi:probable HAF family extracellular repeat protein